MYLQVKSKVLHSPNKQICEPMQSFSGKSRFKCFFIQIPANQLVVNIFDSWFNRPGETRRILSVNPTYDWTCFSYALLNVSPMQVESSPPMPCPEPCHEIKTCSQCLSSRGSDGGWQRCVWSMALQQVSFREVISTWWFSTRNSTSNLVTCPLSSTVYESVLCSAALWGGSVWPFAHGWRFLLSPVLPAYSVLPVHFQAAVRLVFFSWW